MGNRRPQQEDEQGRALELAVRVLEEKAESLMLARDLIYAGPQESAGTGKERKENYWLCHHADRYQKAAKALRRLRAPQPAAEGTDLTDAELLTWFRRYRDSQAIQAGVARDSDPPVWLRLLRELDRRFCARLDRNRPTIVCLCGSTRFVDLKAVLAWEIEKRGRIALGLHLLPGWYPDLESDHQAEAEGVADRMDRLHRRKIDLADHVLVVDVDGYIGESTSAEIEYAEQQGKPIRYWSEEPKLRKMVPVPEGGEGDGGG